MDAAEAFRFQHAFVIDLDPFYCTGYFTVPVRYMSAPDHIPVRVGQERSGKVRIGQDRSG